MKSDAVCIIGARKGSKRLPGKNKQVLDGKPLYSYTVEAAINSGIFNEIIFTTDDEEILKGLEIYSDIICDQRPTEFAGDNVIIWDVGMYILRKYNELERGAIDLCFLTPCHPFRNAEHIRESYSLYKTKRALSLVSITQFPAPPELPLELNDMMVSRKWNGPHRGSLFRSKYYPNGAISIVDKLFFLKHKDFYSPETVGYMMEWPYSLDIDEEKDLILAKMIAEKVAC